MKEELTAGALGIEARYPFLDKNFVQEYLWLKSSNKNREYKSVLDVTKIHRKPVFKFLKF